MPSKKNQECTKKNLVCKAVVVDSVTHKVFINVDYIKSQRECLKKFRDAQNSSECFKRKEISIVYYVSFVQVPAKIGISVLKTYKKFPFRCPRRCSKFPERVQRRNQRATATANSQLQAPQYPAQPEWNNLVIRQFRFGHQAVSICDEISRRCT